METNFKVPLTKIARIESHPNADKMELAYCYGFQLCVPKSRYKVGDLVVFAPIDSILPENIESLVFGPDAKVKLTKSRIRQVKLRGSVSQGLIIDPSLLSGIVNFEYIKPEQDLSQILGISKYEPPEPKGVSFAGNKPGSRKALSNPNFHSYNGLTNIKWAENLLEDQEVIIQCKIHGTNSRFGYLPKPTRNLWDKVLKFLNLFPEYEYCYGSNRVEISSASSYKGYYKEDIYGKVFDKVKAHEKVKKGEIIFGEIYGPGIQKGYSYGLKEPSFILFDVKCTDIDGNQYWMAPEDVEFYAKSRGFDFVPVLYRGPFNKAMAYELSRGPSVLCPDEPVREGCVVKSRYNYSIEGNKVAVKVINEDYLSDATNTDEH